MLNINDDTILVQSTELRTKMPEISKNMKLKKIIILKKGKPFAVLSDFDEYEQKENLIDAFEDMVLGFEAKERHENSGKNDYIDSEKFEKELGI